MRRARRALAPDQPPQAAEPSSGQMRQRDQREITAPVILDEIMPARGKPVIRHPVPALHARRDRADMLDPAVGHVMGLPARPRGAAAEVGFLEIEKERLVEAANGIKYLLPDHQARPRQPVNGLRGLWQRKGHGGAAQEAADGADARGTFELAQDGREAKAAGMWIAVRA